MKTCGVCNETKALTEFNRKGEKYQSKCRDCQKAWYKSYYVNSDVEKKRIRANNDAARAEAQRVTREAKSAPCTDCGVQYPYYVMDFDHLGDKEFNVAQLVREGRTKLAIAEIKKCEVVCSNCHRERTHRRRLTAGVEDATIEE